MNVTINGEPTAMAAELSIDDLVAGRFAVEERTGVAIALNDEVVRRADWSAVRLKDGDRIEIVKASQGG